MPVLKFVALCIHSDELPAPLAPHAPLSPALSLSLSLSLARSSLLFAAARRNPFATLFG